MAAGAAEYSVSDHASATRRAGPTWTSGIVSGVGLPRPLNAKVCADRGISTGDTARAAACSDTEVATLRHRYGSVISRSRVSASVSDSASSGPRCCFQVCSTLITVCWARIDAASRNRSAGARWGHAETVIAVTAQPNRTRLPGDRNWCLPFCYDARHSSRKHAARADAPAPLPGATVGRSSP